MPAQAMPPERQPIYAGVPLDGAAERGVRAALYLREPEGNGVELYWNRPESNWPRQPAGTLAMFTQALDLEALLKVS